MPQILSTLNSFLSCKILTFALALVLQFSSLFLLHQPSFAATNTTEQSTNEEKIERAYDEFGEDAGMREEAYQRRLNKGENPEKMPKPYKHIVDLEGKEVPQTSLVEASVSKAKGLVEKVTGKK
jgi:hypothetical protein